MRLIRRVYRAHTKNIWAYILLGITSSVCTALGVSMLQRLLDGLAGGGVNIRHIALYGVLLMTPYITEYIDNYPSERLKHDIYHQLKLEALEKMRTVSYTAWQRVGTGTLIQRVESGADAGRNMCLGFYLELVARLIPQILISVAFIALVSMQVFWWVLVGYVAVFAVTNVLLKALYRIKERILLDEERLSHRLVRGFMEMVVFRFGRRYPEEIRLARGEAENVSAAKTKMLMIHEAFFAGFAVLVGLMKIGVIVYAYAANEITVGGVVALIAYLDNAYVPIAIFNVDYVQYKLNRVAYARFEAFLAAEDTENLLAGEDAVPEDGAVRFENVGCTYDGKRVYEGLSFDIPAGALVGLAGESGAGKSSALRQLTGLIPIEEGRITIGGADVSRARLDDLYRYISYTPQETPVFDATLRENIAHGKGMPDDVLWEALDAVELGDMVRALPERLDAKVGERGVMLSGGERQRLALARLFFAADAKLFLLDEATSAMDNLVEERALSATLEQMRGKTVVMIAHRLDTLKGADFILLMRDGKIAGRGSYEQLKCENAYFQELLRAQSERGSVN